MESRQHYFDSIFHSAAVVGINTSAQIERGDRRTGPLHTVLAEEFRRTQLGTLHFPYLAGRGLSGTCTPRGRSPSTGRCSRTRSTGDGHHDGTSASSSRFVRPFGLDVPAAPKVVEELEATAALSAPAPDRGPAAGPVVRLALSPFAARAARGPPLPSETARRR